MRNNFLDEFFYKQEQVPTLLKAYKGVFDILRNQVKEVDNNHKVSTMLTYRRIQFQRIDITPILYNINDIVNHIDIITSMNMSTSSTFEDRLNAWNNLKKLEQAKLLDLIGYSIQLNSKIHIGRFDEANAWTKYDIIDFELCDIYNTTLEANIDYCFFDNKLVLLKNFPLDDFYKRKFLIMKNIVIDINTIEDNLGVPLNIPYSVQFTKADYADALKAFTKAAAGGPTINNLTDALTKYKGLEGVSIFDKYNADDSRRGLWSYSNENFAEYTQFDFIVALPPEFVNKTNKLEYIRSFFNQIKPSYTAFNLVPEIKITDDLTEQLLPLEIDRFDISTSVSEDIEFEDFLQTGNENGMSLSISAPEESFSFQSQVSKFDLESCVCDSIAPFMADMSYNESDNQVEESLNVKLIVKG